MKQKKPDTRTSRGAADSEAGFDLELNDAAIAAQQVDAARAEREAAAMAAARGNSRGAETDGCDCD